MQQIREHHITTVGDRPAIRLATDREDVEYIYPEKNDS